MIYDYVVESANLLSEEILKEDRMVKYNGELSPKFGWCLMIVGGAAAGKSSAGLAVSRLQGKYYNVDDFKKIPKDKEGNKVDNKRWHIKNPKTGKPYVDELPSSWEDRDLKGAFAGQLHATFDDLNQKRQDSITHNANVKNTDPSRLPNIIFDVTGKRLSKFKEIIGPAKEQGYKIAIIWVASVPEKAVAMAKKRGRGYGPNGLSPQGLQDLVNLHEQIADVIQELFSSGYIKNVDEFWVVDNTVNFIPDKQVKEYHDAQNVYHVKCTPDGLEQADKRVRELIKLNHNYIYSEN